MAYSNDLIQIRAGLVNYLGACLTTAHSNERVAKHNVVSILAEEALSLSKQTKEEACDLFIAKPLLRSVLFIINERIREMEKLPNSPQVRQKIGEYVLLSQQLDVLIQSIQ